MTGCNAFDRQHNVMKSNLSLSLKRKVYDQCILSVPAYGSETWSLTKDLERKIQSVQRGMMQITLGITWRDKKRASWIRKQTKIEDMGRTRHATNR